MWRACNQSSTTKHHLLGQHPTTRWRLGHLLGKITSSTCTLSTACSPRGSFHQYKILHLRWPICQDPWNVLMKQQPSDSCRMMINLGLGRRRTSSASNADTTTWSLTMTRQLKWQQTLKKTRLLSPLTIQFFGTTICKTLKGRETLSLSQRKQSRDSFCATWGSTTCPRSCCAFYRATKSILCSFVSVWFSSALQLDKGRLKSVVRSVQHIIRELIQ